MRYGRDVLVSGVEARRVARASGEEGPCKGAVGGEDEEDGGVGDGFGACGGGVAVEDVVGGEGARVDPVEACAGAGVDFAGGGEEGAGVGVSFVCVCMYVVWCGCVGCAVAREVKDGWVA